MKTLINVTFLVLITFMLSCSSDEGTDLTGVWELTQFKVNCPSTGENFDLNAQNGCFTFDGDETCFSIDLKDDGTATITLSENGNQDSFTYSYTHTETSATICDPSNDCQTFQLADGKLSYNENEGDCTLTYVFER